MKTTRDYEVKIHYNQFNVSLTLNLNKESFYDDVTNIDVIRYLKSVFTNKERYINRFIDKIREIPDKYTEFHCPELLDELINIYDDVTPFTYQEAFKIENREFQAKVFGSINIGEMISNLGNERIAVEGKAVKHKIFDSNGEFLGIKEYDIIYETHEVNGKELGVDGKIYALKCWCTTTDKEHWLWIEEQYKDKPLDAVASTFRIHESLIPYIKELKRQGDILLVEMKEGSSDVKPEGEIIPLTSEQYFELLTAQS